MVRRVARCLVAVLVGMGATTACGTTAATPTDTTTVTVFAAASLTEPFTEIGRRFELDHPEFDVVFNFASSSQLAVQISEGAPVDVFAAADTVAMADALSDGLADGTDEPQPTVFATNSLAIAVEPGNPHGIERLADLADDDLIVVVCAPEVPCGRYATTALDGAGLVLDAASYEPNVKSVVSKVALGEADAGIVYATDVAATDQVDGVAIAPDENVTADYPIVVTNPNNPGASVFVDYVAAGPGQTVLSDLGFSAAAGL